MKTLHRLALPLTMVLVGCVGPWEVLSSPTTTRSPLTFNNLKLSFDRGAIPPGQQGDETFDLNEALARVEDDTARALDDSLDTINVVRSQQALDADAVRAVITWEAVEPGRTGVHATPSRLTARITWWIQGRTTDEIRITERLQPSIFALDGTDRLRRCAQRIGAHLGAWVQDQLLP